MLKTKGSDEEAALSGRQLYLVRHGQTQWNRVRRLQGEADSPLTTRGWEDARRVADALRGLPVQPSVVISSPLGRAQATASVISSRLGCPVALHPALHEIRFGEASGLTRDEIDARWPELASQRASERWTTRWPGGESYSDLADRAVAFLQGLRAPSWQRRVDGSSHVLVVAHQSMNMALLHVATGLSRDACLGVRQDHCEIVRIVDRRAETLRCDAPDGGWQRLRDAETRPVASVAPSERPA